MEEQHDVAIVGCGVIAETHLQALKKLGGFKVLAVCDSDEKKAIATSKRWKVDHYYTDFSKMLSNEDISILSILTPPSSHASLAIEAIKHDVNVVIEKPLTMTTEEADSIIKALRTNGAKMTVVYHYLSSKAMLKALSLIKEHGIGEILNVDMKFIHNLKSDYMASSPDHWCHKLAGGRFGEMLPHPVYVVQSILGDNLQLRNMFLSKRGNIAWLHNDELHAILESEKGFGSIYVSLNAPKTLYACDVYGTKGILRIDLIRQIVLRLGPVSASKSSVAKDSLSEASRLFLSTIENALEFSFRKQGEFAVSKVYTTFVDSIREGIEPPVTPKMAYNTVRIVEEMCEAI